MMKCLPLLLCFGVFFFGVKSHFVAASAPYCAIWLWKCCWDVITINFFLVNLQWGSRLLFVFGLFLRVNRGIFSENSGERTMLSSRNIQKKLK